MLKRILKEKSCLIVIDEVRKHNDFDKLQILLQCTGVRTRVIITTRDKDVAIVASGKSIPLQLRSLTEKESWKLFFNKALIPEDSLNDSVLISLKKKILRKCDGSPQAIIELAGLLSTRNLTEWSNVIEHAFLEENILASSYEDLPPQTKPCFLYLGLFPGAFQIPVRRLPHLWLAEGLLTPLPEQNMASEDPAEKYFKEIINRGLIEVARLRSDGSPETCHLPGILWDFFPKAVGSRLFHAHNTTDYTSAEPPKFNIRRLAEYVGIKSYPSFDPYIQYLRCYISFNTRKRDLPAQEIGTFLNTIVIKRGFGLLRVLDLEDVYKPMLPGILRKFLYLKYLGLRWTFL
ncbi:disease resistance protein RPP13 [Quercus suber]|uniref:disease resistance protein RPP13 n=1 Tax=Quercus suber TaxID=58331 RepID=UPI0032DEA961